MRAVFDDRALVVKVEDAPYLIVADLHLGYEVDLSEKTGTQFPNQQDKILDNIVTLVEKYKVEHLYIVGDVKHTILTDSYYNWQIIPELMEKILELVPVTIIPGNHDGNLTPLLPRSIEVTEIPGIIIGSKEDQIGLVHGHAWPSDNVLNANMIVSGHNHPNIRRYRDGSSDVIGRPDRRRSSYIIPVAIKSKLNRDCVRRARGQLEMNDGDTILVTLPPFNDLITGISINRSDIKFQGPLFDNECAQLASSEVYSFDGVYLGTVKQLQTKYNLDDIQRNH